eukprot:tig00021721_g23218.t1
MRALTAIALALVAALALASSEIDPRHSFKVLRSGACSPALIKKRAFRIEACSRTAVDGELALNVSSVEALSRAHSLMRVCRRTNYINSWDFGGAAILEDRHVRLTPALDSRSGWLFNMAPVEVPDWEAVFEFRVHGPKNPGADGLAFWYVDKPHQQGPVFGGAEKFRGLAVIFDTFDNDGRHNNPAVYAMVNDGTKSFDHQHDGAAHTIGMCVSEYRNQPHYVKVRVSYVKRGLAVAIDARNTGTFEECFRAADVVVPTGYYLGFTAATGYYFDNHDVMSFQFRPIDGDELNSLPSGGAQAARQEQAAAQPVAAERPAETPNTQGSQQQAPPAAQETQQAPPPPPPPQQQQQQQQQQPAAPQQVSGNSAAVEAAVESLRELVNRQAGELRSLKEQNEALKQQVANLGTSLRDSQKQLLDAASEGFKGWVKKAWQEDLGQLTNRVNDFSTQLARAKSAMEGARGGQPGDLAGLQETVAQTVKAHAGGGLLSALWWLLLFQALAMGWWIYFRKNDKYSKLI